jgi:hypothetical protein
MFGQSLTSRLGQPKEAPMKDRTGRAISKRKAQKKRLSTRAIARDAERERVNDRLDEALRQTFPASDALSIIQIVRCS